MGMAPGKDDASLELRSLQLQIHDRLLRQVLRGELQPGERISPPEIAARLGVSITPVRDAVNLLAAEGLVNIAPRRGTVVSPVSPSDIDELYEIRLMIEPPAAATASERASAEDIERMRELAERLESSPAGTEQTVDDLKAYLRENAVEADFHAAIVRYTGNRRLTAIYDGLRTHVLVARTIFPRLYRGQPHRRGEHQRILEAIAAHDGDRARAAMVSHLERALADMRRHVAGVSRQSGPSGGAGAAPAGSEG
jgi:DNA-binding GntR family transcriptional regulator